MITTTAAITLAQCKFGARRVSDVRGRRDRPVRVAHGSRRPAVLLDETKSQARTQVGNGVRSVKRRSCNCMISLIVSVFEEGGGDLKQALIVFHRRL